MKNGFAPALHRLLRRLLTEPQQLAAVRSSPRAPWFVLWTVCVGAFMGQLDASNVAAALPALAHSLHATVDDVQWVSLSYTLVLASTVVTVGHIADAAGRKRLYLGGFLVFTASSALCGLAPTLALLIVARLVQALGATMMQANSYSLIIEATPEAQLRRAFGWQSLAQSLGLGLGPALGGVLLSFLSWRWLFWVNLPAGALGIGLGWFLLPQSSSRRRPDFGDLPGALLLALGAGLPLIYLSLAHTVGYANGLLAVALVGGVASAVWFVIHERRAVAPLIDLSMFRHPALSAGLGSGLVLYIVLFAALSGVSYDLAGDHVKSLAAGIQLAALPMALAITAWASTRRRRRGAHRRTIVGSLLTRRAPVLTRRLAARARPGRPCGRIRRLTASGLILTGAGLLEMVLWPGHAGLRSGLVIAGVGCGLFIPANTTGIVGAVPGGRRGVISGILNMNRSMGTTLGVALASLLYTTVGGLTPTLTTLAVMAELAAFMLLVLPAEPSTVRDPDAERGDR